MAKKYMVKYSGNSVELSKPNSTMLVYKFPYSDLERRRIGFKIANPFIVYILLGKNAQGRDMIYVGKSKRGPFNRPTSHKDKYANWTTCYILTQFIERTFFNDGTIQYLEDQINRRIQEIELYENTTKTTSSGTANKDDMEDCNEYLEEAYDVLGILGLDLITNSEEDIAERDIEDTLPDVEARKLIPNGEYYFERTVQRLDGQILKGKMQVKDGVFILKAGSDVAPDESGKFMPSVSEARSKARVEDGVLMDDIQFSSPSACGAFIIGSACNGWTNWKTKDGKPIDIFRKQGN